LDDEEQSQRTAAWHGKREASVSHRMRGRLTSAGPKPDSPLYDRRVLRIGWEKEQAKFVARNRVRKSIQGRDDGPSYVLQVWDFMVEVPGPDGQPTRLVIRVKNPNLDLPELGATVPVLVNRRRTKAAFDLDDPSISPDARRKLGEQRHKAKAAEKQAKFDAKLSERD
jgi:hypothetical protein